MSQQQWTAVDDYFSDVLIGEDKVLADALVAADAAGLPHINVAPNQGKLLNLLARTLGARRILEVGTLGGYSTIWLGRALPETGTLISLEIDPAHAAIATANLERAGLSGVAQVLIGPAVETLAELAQAGVEPFDFVFIDADKPNNPVYVDWAVRLSRPGSLIVVDNVVRGGAVADAASSDASVLAVRRMHDRIAADPRLSATSIQTVGVKGYDGFTLIRVD